MVGLPDGEKNFVDMYNRIHTISACDGRTDRRIDILPRHSPRYAYASRGKTKMRWAARITPNGVKPRLCVCYVSFRIILNDVDNNCFSATKFYTYKAIFENLEQSQCFGPLLEYYVRVWCKFIWKWPRNMPNNNNQRQALGMR